jgi:uncharacterized RDD family membrane protein YckC
MTDSELQQKRFIAAVIDIVVAFAIAVVFVVLSWILGMVAIRSESMAFGYLPRVLGFAGSLVSLGYVLARDIIGGGTSIGKKTQGLRVVTTAGAPIGFMDSAKRNAIFALGSALGVLSATLGLVPCIGDVVRCLLTPLLLLGMLASLVAAVVEIIKISQDPEGVRLGDAFAGTRVVR